MEATHMIVHDYIERGFSPVPVKFRSKICTINEWPKARFGHEEILEVFKLPCNVGIILGDASCGLVDIDLDCSQAIDLAPYILPATAMIFGRASKPRSHWLYRVSDPGKLLRLADPETGQMLVELRATGCMTVFPPSVHETGEEVRFDQGGGDPTKIEFDQLVLYARQLAAVCLLLPHWEENQRHNLALALAGTLLMGGVAEDDARRLFDAVIKATGDEEGEDRIGCLASTAERVRTGQPNRGRKELAAIIGEKATNRFCEWFGLTSGPIELSGQIGSVTTAYGGSVPESDTANAERFAAGNRDRARYSYDLKKWVVWEGCRWAIDADGEIDRLASATVKALAIEAASRNQKDSLTWAAKSHDLTRLRSMITLAQSRCSVRSEAFDADPWTLNCRSGIVDLRKGELVSHDPGSLMRKLAPVEFDPAAKCPTFNAFLARIFEGDPELIAFLQRAIGYSLTGRTDEECLFVLVGSGANGKSTLIRVIQDLLGDYAQQTPMETLMVSKSGAISNDIARLEGARFVAAVEAEAGQRLAEAKIKQLTGGDRITARYMYGEYFEFTPRFKLWLATNKLPEIRGTDEGIWRRLRVVPFNVTIPEGNRDGSLPDKLRAELPGILNWALTGCLEWQRGGLRPPGSVADATKAYRADMDVVTQFIEDCCTVDRKAEETVKVLYSNFTEWCYANGETLVPQKPFGQRLKELGFQEARSGKARKRRGIRLKTEPELHYGGLVLADDASDALGAE